MVLVMNMLTMGKKSTRGVVDAVSATIVGFIIVAATLFSVYTVLRTVSYIYINAPESRYRSELRITNARAHTNGTIFISITNLGPVTIEDVRKIEVAVTVAVGNSYISYLAVYGDSSIEGYWSTCGKYVEDKEYGTIDNYTLKPGELLCARVRIHPIPMGSYIGLTVYTSRGERSEFVTIAR